VLKPVSVVVIFGGAILAIVAAGADVLPMSVPGFGWKQIAGTIMGISLSGAGIAFFKNE